ncbi:rCG42524, isoform CRA_b [Rattus norvegicus]|uniref:RCG42524, isoform CRA_b n=1 Tax=Rattus norvegicus TaxID=10116 RepID=A6K1Q9_RAT|nr:rCG42524, isoform CRA_b [Rattus norvegicus]
MMEGLSRPGGAVLKTRNPFRR